MPALIVPGFVIPECRETDVSLSINSCLVLNSNLAVLGLIALVAEALPREILGRSPSRVDADPGKCIGHESGPVLTARIAL